MEVEAFIDRAAGFGGVQRDDTDASAMCFVHAELDQPARESAPAMRGRDEDIEQVAALLAAGVERMRRPVEDEKTGGSDRLAFVDGDPAGIPVVANHAFGPGSGVALNLYKRVVGGDVIFVKHGSTVRGDESRIGWVGGTEFHLGSIRFGADWIAAKPYHRFVPSVRDLGLKLDTALLRPGMRLGVGVSGGADSVALLRVLHARAAELGLVLHVAHLHHGLRGAEADADLGFVKGLAAELGSPFHEARVDTAAEAAARVGKAAESIEEAARRLRYAWFRELMSKIPLDAVATAHTLDDQAESVLGKFLRGAWTEGLSGIHPRVEFAEGGVVRPLLKVRRGEIEAYLKGLGQGWCEDSTNSDTAFTRNRIRHELLPMLEGWNPRLRAHLANMAELARDEDFFLASEVEKLAGKVVLPGRPVRGGGRAASEGVALEIGQLAAQPVAMQRRILRFVTERLGAALDFVGTEALRELALTGTAGQRCELAGGLRAERSHRELRLAILAAADAEVVPDAVEVPVPGEVESAEFGVRVRIVGASADSAVLRNWKAGDRVTLRHSSGPRKVKEVLERMKVSGAERAVWPVVEWQGKILWMQGVVVEAEPGVEVQVVALK